MTPQDRLSPVKFIMNATQGPKWQKSQGFYTGSSMDSGTRRSLHGLEAMAMESAQGRSADPDGQFLGRDVTALGGHGTGTLVFLYQLQQAQRR